MSTFVNTDPSAFKGVWVFCEQREGKLMPTDFELISEGRKLADDLGVELCGLLLGDKVEGLAQELGGFGITVNAIAAGLTAGTASSAATTEDVRERIIAMTPLGRLARPDDIAGGVALLASDMAGFITGQCLHVDGGLTMR